MQKYMPSRPVHSRICLGVLKRGTFIHYQTVKLQSKHVAVCLQQVISWSRGRSGSIVSNYRLDEGDRGSISGRGRGFFL
jgi:hypothetical protein